MHSPGQLWLSVSLQNHPKMGTFPNCLLSRGSSMLVRISGQRQTGVGVTNSTFAILSSFCCPFPTKDGFRAEFGWGWGCLKVGFGIVPCGLREGASGWDCFGCWLAGYPCRLACGLACLLAGFTFLSSRRNNTQNDKHTS